MKKGFLIILVEKVAKEEFCPFSKSILNDMSEEFIVKHWSISTLEAYFHSFHALLE